MNFRDDLQAAIFRADAAEKEIRRLKRELEKARAATEAALSKIPQKDNFDEVTQQYTCPRCGFRVSTCAFDSRDHQGEIEIICFDY